MWKVSDWNGKDGGDEGHWEKYLNLISDLRAVLTFREMKYNCYDSENHDCLTLSPSESSLVSCEPGFEGIGMLLLKVEKMS